MAAEKLTKQRLIQILVMLTLLTGAFIWRTIDHYQQQNQCITGANCQVSFTDSAVKLQWDSNLQVFRLENSQNNSYRVILIDGAASIRNRPEHTQIKLQERRVDVEIYNIVNNQKRVVTLKSKN